MVTIQKVTGMHRGEIHMNAVARRSPHREGSEFLFSSPFTRTRRTQQYKELLNCCHLFGSCFLTLRWDLWVRDWGSTTQDINAHRWGSWGQSCVSMLLHRGAACYWLAPEPKHKHISHQGSPVIIISCLVYSEVCFCVVKLADCHWGHSFLSSNQV